MVDGAKLALSKCKYQPPITLSAFLRDCSTGEAEIAAQRDRQSTTIRRARDTCEQEAHEKCRADAALADQQHSSATQDIGALLDAELKPDCTLREICIYYVYTS